MVASEVLARGRKDIPDVERLVCCRVTRIHVEDFISENDSVVGVEALEKLGIEVVVCELVVSKEGGGRWLGNSGDI